MKHRDHPLRLHLRRLVVRLRILRDEVLGKRLHRRRTSRLLGSIASHAIFRRGPQLALHLLDRPRSVVQKLRQAPLTNANNQDDTARTQPRPGMDDHLSVEATPGSPLRVAERDRVRSPTGPSSRSPLHLFAAPELRVYLHLHPADHRRRQNGPHRPDRLVIQKTRLSDLPHRPLDILQCDCAQTRRWKGWIDSGRRHPRIRPARCLPRTTEIARPPPWAARPAPSPAACQSTPPATPPPPLRRSCV